MCFAYALPYGLTGINLIATKILENKKHNVLKCVGSARIQIPNKIKCYSFRFVGLIISCTQIQGGIHCHSKSEFN